MCSRFLSIVGLVAVVAAVGFGQSVPVSDTVPNIDGVLDDGEYAYTQDVGKMSLGIHRTGDRLYVSVVGQTDGWVAAGLGSRRMDGARILFGFVDDKGPQFRLDLGKGHRHRPTDDASVISTAVVEQGETTTLEAELDASEYITEGQSSLDLIMAYGGADNFRSIHRFYNSRSIELE